MEETKDKMEISLQLLKLDISGQTFKIPVSDLWKFEGSLLHKIAQVSPSDAIKMGLCRHYDSNSQSYFFNRPVHIFPTILATYATGLVHIGSGICAEAIRQEIKFWMLPTSAFDPECIPLIPESQKSLWIPPKAQSPCKYESLTRKFCFGFRRSLWYILEKPGSCKVALLFMFVSVMFVFASMFILVMGTVPTFQRKSKSMNVTKTVYEFMIADDVCVAWFTLEYILRVLTAPFVLHYIATWPALVDLLSFVPAYIEIGLSVYNTNNNKGDTVLYLQTMNAIRSLTVFRCLRLIKLVRYSAGMLAIFRTLRKSLTVLMLMVVFILMADLFMATLIYFLESGVEDTQFNSIPAAAWWGIVTMTTVGYGDMVPTTVGGKLVASLSVLLGIIVVALPVSVITTNFGLAYAEVNEKFDHEIISMKKFIRNPWLPHFPDSDQKRQNRNVANNGDGATLTLLSH